MEPRSVELPRTLDWLSQLAAIRGDDAETRAFAQAAAFARARGLETERDLRLLLDAPPPDLAPGLLNPLRRVHDAGGWVQTELAIADLPSDLRWLLESEAVTLDQLTLLHRALGVVTCADLLTAVDGQAIRCVPGLDAGVEQAIAAALPALRTQAPRIPIGRALAIAEPVLDILRTAPGVIWALPAGSLRRGEDTVGDIEILAPAEDPAPALDAVESLAGIERIRHRGPRRLYCMIDRTQVGIRSPVPDAAAATLVHLTGSRVHVRRLRELAFARGLTLALDGLHDSSQSRIPALSEEDIYTRLEIPYVPAELRNGEDELEAAQAGVLPRLVNVADIRGDLHMHTSWSDGRDSVEAMVQASIDLGYQYMAITDHSPSSAASRNLAETDVALQAEEIARVRERFPQIAILHGCEVDILHDGRLDFSDRVLRRFDIVLASLHDRANHTSEQLLTRYLRAMLNPLVAIVTHPTNRLFPQRPGYEMSYDRLFEAAADTHTALEIDGAPTHVDLDAALARRAIQAGATVAIDSDAHRNDMLGRHMRIGLLTARRGWVEPRHVLNVRSLPEVRAFVAHKRQRPRG